MGPTDSQCRMVCPVLDSVTFTFDTSIASLRPFSLEKSCSFLCHLHVPIPKVVESTSLVLCKGREGDSTLPSVGAEAEGSTRLDCERARPAHLAGETLGQGVRLDVGVPLARSSRGRRSLFGNPPSPDALSGRRGRTTRTHDEGVRD